MEALHVGGGRQRVTHSQSSTYASHAVSLAPAMAPVTLADNDNGLNMRNIDSNLGTLCEHVQVEGWKSKAFSDIVVKAMGRTFLLHRLLLSRSSFFRNMLQGPWREAGAPEVTLQIDDENVNADAVETALAYLYGHYPKLDDTNAFRVLAAGSFLDLQDLCSLCTNFIISELYTENFLAYQAFAESQDYGVHGERVRKACWGYLCRGGAVELREILPKLSTQTLRKLLTSDELWVLSEEKRFELASYVLAARGVVLEMPQMPGTESKGSPIEGNPATEDLVLSVSSADKDQKLEETPDKVASRLTSDGEVSHVSVEGAQVPTTKEVAKTVHDILFELVDSAVTNFSAGISSPSTSLNLNSCDSAQGNQGLGAPVCMCDHGLEALNGKPLKEVDPSQAFIEIRKDGEACTSGDTCSTPGQLNFSGAESGFCGRFGFEEPWNPPRTGEHVGHDLCSPSPETTSSPSSKVPQDQWSRDSACPTPSWGGRVVERRMKKAFPNNGNCGIAEDWEAFLGVFEGGGVLYCHMTFDDLLYMRGRLEELGFPCKAVADSLWLQTHLRQQVLTIAADTCRSCSLVYANCSCRQFNPSYAHSRISGLLYRDDGQSTDPIPTGIFPGAEGIGGTSGSGIGVSSQSAGRVHVRNTIDGLAGVGRGTTFGAPGSWPAPRFLYIPTLGAYGGRGNPQQSGGGNNQADVRLDLIGRDLAVAHYAPEGPTQGGTASASVPSPVQPDLTSRTEGSSVAGKPASIDTSLSNVSIDKDLATKEYEAGGGGSIQLDLNTPLRSFPPFRFGVEFEDVNRLQDGQSKHSPEAFYGGSLWKVSVQAFNDEDPRGRRTLGNHDFPKRADRHFLTLKGLTIEHNGHFRLLFFSFCGGWAT
uniref:BTB domain-containing protein n=1 Tax=Physcomitrium patens TaxID=3218 RepID=A0A7I4DVJ9_PHYPA